MPYFLAGLALLIAGLIAQRWYVTANPATLARNLTRMAGVFLMMLATLAAVLRRVEFAAPLAVIAMMFLRRGWSSTPQGWGGGANASKTTSVQSERVEMTLDHDTGETDGVVLQGMHEGMRFSQLDLAALSDVLRECQQDDPEGVTLLQAYLDTMHAGWRDGTAQHDANAGGGAGSQGAAGQSAISRAHAYEILGLNPGASEDDIRDAHRTLMRKLHPDQGGSTYLAQQINEAKDVLLGEG